LEERFRESSWSGWPRTTAVKATALDALALGFETVVLRDGVRAVNLQPGDGEAALASIRDAGGIII
jgi:nicotinamidase/pyrazinamidase